MTAINIDLESAWVLAIAFCAMVAGMALVTLIADMVWAVVEWAWGRIKR